MKPRPIEPCVVEIPEPLLRAADHAERRVEAALDRVLIKLDANGHGGQLAALIAHDKAMVGK